MTKQLYDGINKLVKSLYLEYGIRDSIQEITIHPKIFDEIDAYLHDAMLNLTASPWANSTEIVYRMPSCTIKIKKGLS